MGRRLIDFISAGLFTVLHVMTFTSCPDMDLRYLVEDKVEGVYYVNLSALEISQGTLSPAFRTDVSSYSTWVQSTVTSIAVTPTAIDAGASITVNGAVTASGTASGSIALAAGPNTITIEVTSEDRTATKTFLIALYRAIRLPQTGQTTSYATGDDGDLEKGVAWPVPRFQDNGDGTVTDKLTGLMWVKDGNLMTTRDPTFDNDSTVNDGRVTWQHALDYVELLNNDNYANHTDWRLPNIRELRSLVNYSQTFPYDWLNLSAQKFINVQDYYYWSSTTDLTDTAYAWNVFMWNGHVHGYPKTNYYHALAVRTGQSGGEISLPKTGQTISYATNDDGELQKGIESPTVRFQDNGDGTITDCLTGLMWDQSGNRFGLRTWTQALTEVDLLSLGGYNDWRLPNVNEFESLFNTGEAVPAAWLHGQGFIGLMADDYFSSTTCAFSTSSVWDIGMGDGDVGERMKTATNYVLAVRDGQ